MKYAFSHVNLFCDIDAGYTEFNLLCDVGDI